jgi:hypothetical protein
MSDALKPARSYVTKGKRRREANKMPQDPSDVQESAWKKSKKRGEEKASAALGGDVLQNLIAQYKKAEGKDAADGILRGALALGKISDHQFRSAFGVGPQRLDRLRREHPELQPVGKQYSEAELLFLRDFIQGIEREVGFACAHKWQREYLLQGSFTDHWKKYTARAEENGVRAVGFNRFYVTISEIRPWLRSSRLREDECTVCLAIDTQLKYNDALTDEERNELKMRREVHWKDARDQRHEMNSVIAEMLKAWNEPPPAEPACLLDANNESEPLEDGSCIVTGEGSDRGQACTRLALVMCQDYGQSQTVPAYMLRRPGSNYFSSNLMAHKFVVCDTTQNQNFVYVYDERDAAKGCDAVCSLRWNHLCKLWLQLEAAGREFPSRLVIVMDNCPGQNKSHLTFRFDMLISVVFNVTITNLYLKPGHSHMRADRIVALSKRVLRGRDLYTLPEIVTQMDTAKTLTAELFTDVFYDWQSLLEKHFPRIPAGSSKHYCFEVGNLVLKMFTTAIATVPSVTVPFGSSLTADALRRGVLKDLTGLPGDAHPKTIVTAPLLLAKTAKIELSAAKVRSIWDDVHDKVPPQALSYFPHPPEEEPSVEPPEEAPEEPTVTQPISAESSAMPPPTLPSSGGRRRPGPKPKAKPVEPGTQSIAVMFQRLNEQSQAG